MEPITITILGIDYKVSCAPNEEEALRRSATLLDSRLNTMRINGRMSIEQAAVMVGLNLANELLKSESSLNAIRSDWLSRIEQLNRQIDEVTGNKII